MRVMRAVIAVAALVCVAGCANGGGPTHQSVSASPLSTPTVPSSCAVPGAPGNLSAEVTGTTVNLSWSAVGDATDYVVLVGWTPASSETVLTNTSEAHHWIESIARGHPLRSRPRAQLVRHERLVRADRVLG